MDSVAEPQAAPEETPRELTARDMYDIKKQFHVIVTKLNFWDPVFQHTLVCEAQPTEDDVYQALEECAKSRPSLRHYSTEVEVKQVWDLSYTNAKCKTL